MSIEVQNESGVEFDVFRTQRLSRFVMDRMRVHPLAELSITAVDEDTIAGLNTKWMDKEGPTDVLAFPMDELRPGMVNEEPEEGVLGETTTLVHATHLTESDTRLIGEAGAFVCFCPTTERDLADGIGPSRALHEAGARLTLGSDSHAVIDLFEEMRGVEMHERLRTQQRGHWSAAELLDAATVTGHASLGFSDAGRIAVGQRADLRVLDLDSWRLRGAGATAEAVVFAATGADAGRLP